MQAEPGLVRDTHEPKGVLRKNLKPLIYLGAAALVIVAAIFSGTSKKTPSQQAAARHEPPQPTVQDNTDNNVQDLKNQLAAEQQKEAQQAGVANATVAQQAAAAAYSPTGQAVPCAPGQPCAQPNMNGQQPGGQPQVSPEQEEAQQLAAKERELAYNSRFASNLVYSHQLGYGRFTAGSERDRRAQAWPVTSKPRTQYAGFEPGWEQSGLSSRSWRPNLRGTANKAPSSSAEVNIDSAAGPAVCDL